MGSPPLEAGAVQEMLAAVVEATVAVTPIGAPGGPSGVTALEAGEAGEVPRALVAVAVKVYDDPWVRPLTVQLVVEVVQVKPPGEEVTV